jgi:MFS family permease
MGLLCYAGAMGLFAVASDVVWLFLGQMLRGVGAALMWISAYTIATDLVGSRERGEAVGRVDEAAAQGQLFGGIAGFLIMTNVPPETGWQLVFVGYAVLAALGAWLGWKSIPETQPPQTRQTERTRAISPQLYRLMVMVFALTLSSSMLAPLFLVFLQDQFTTAISTLVLVSVPSAIVASYLPSRLGKLSDRFGRVHFMALGLAIAGLVSFVLPGLPGVLWLAIVWTVESLGWAVAQPAQEAMVADLTSRQVRGRGYGMYTFASGLGATIGPLVGGWLYDAAGYGALFYLNGFVLLIGAVSAVVLLRPEPAAGHTTLDAV